MELRRNALGPKSAAGTLRHIRVFTQATCAAVFLASSSLAADPETTPTSRVVQFGKVTHLQGGISATSPADGTERRLKHGDPVFVGERVRAAPDGEALVGTTDAGRIAIRPGTEFIAEKFVAEGKSTDSATIRIVSGSLRVITGWISWISRASHRIVTPTATIGIRGTDHETFVLTADHSAAARHKPGTYDKVNRGRTRIVVGEQSLDVDSGRVGFAPAPADGSAPTQPKTRLLLTVLMPVLLERVPDFYVPGKFDDEMDRYAAISDAESRKALKQHQKERRTAKAECKPLFVARVWLRQLDEAALRLDAPAILARFAPEVVVQATVRNTDGSTVTTRILRDDLGRSTVEAIRGLTGYSHRRLSVEATTVDPSRCDVIRVISAVVESGRQHDKPYRFESIEEYVIELRDGLWLAVEAKTTQR